LAVGVVRDGEVGDADESSEEGDDSKAGRRDSSIRGALYESDESSSNECQAASHIDSPSKVPKCPSTEDAITEEDLPPLHVCYITPKGSNRYCFELETLRQIALKSNDKKYNADDGKVAFLQPLHFRTIISDDLRDQIASRFGRDALDINGPYYNRTNASVDGISFNDTPALAPVYEASSFIDRLRRFARTIMGSRDLYVCPLCYSAAYRKMNDGANAPSRRISRIRDIPKLYTQDFKYDPMTILGFLDDNEFVVAATFCFPSASKTKKHLLVDHGVNPRMVRGNDLYERFAVRTLGY
jgi:hypothetical protein